MKIKKILKTILKNILVLLTGAVGGAVIGAVFLLKPLFEAAAQKYDVGLGIIALAPILFLIYEILFATIGAALGFLIYNFVKYFKKTK